MGGEEGNAEKQKRVRKNKVVLDHTLVSRISPDAKHVRTLLILFNRISATML